MSELQLQEYSSNQEAETVQASRLIEQPIGEDWDLRPVTIEVYRAPVNQLIVEVANQLGVSVVIPESSDALTISVRYQDTPGQQVVEDIADHLGMVSEFDGATIRFVSEDDAAHDFVVIRAGYKSATELVEDLTSLLNNNVRVRAVDDRVVVSGRRRDLEQVKRLEEHLQTGPDGWTLNVRIVGVTESFRRDLGLDWDFSANLGYSASDLAGIISSEIAVKIIAEATETRTDAFLAYQASTYVMEGSTSEVTQGRRVPVPRYQTSPEGTTTTVGYDYIDAGFNLTVAAERVPVGVRLELEPSISTVTGFVGDAPITEQSSVQSEIAVTDGEWIIITGLATEQASSGHKGIPGFKRLLGHESNNSDRTSLLVLVQARRTFRAGGI